MAEISNTLDYLENNYNISLSFFKGFESSLNIIQEVYEGYNLHYVVYSGLFVIATLLTIKIISVCIKAIQCYPLVTTYWSDFSEFRQQCLYLRNEGVGGLERAMPLVPLVQRARLKCYVT